LLTFNNLPEYLGASTSNLSPGTGTGSELRRPLGITIVGGLIVSQMLTLYTTPVVYLFFDRLRLRFRGKQPATLLNETVEAS